MRTATQPYIHVGEPESGPNRRGRATGIPRGLTANDNYEPKLTPLMWVVGPSVVAAALPAVAPARTAPARIHPRRVSLALMGIAVLAAAGIVIGLCPSAPNAVAGLSIRDLVSVAMIVFLSGVMSGLSGFGFSAVGAVSLLFLAPTLQVPLFQALSTTNQLLSVRQLREDMPKSAKELWGGPGPCMLGGAAGVPIGIWVLSHLPASGLMALFGSLLTAYAAYSILKPSSLRLRGFDGPVSGAVVGFFGGVVGGFTAFPGAAVVVWTGLRGLSKERHRAIVQPYIIMSQIYSLVLVAILHPAYLGAQFWVLLALTLPAVAPGTLSGLAIYRKTSDVSFKRVCYLLLGISGFSLLAKTCGQALRSWF